MRNEAAGGDFDDLDLALRALDALCPPGELQGLLLGLVAGGRPPAEAEWLAVAARHGGFRHAPEGSEGAALLALRTTTLAATRDPELGLRLLLPPDDSALAVRVDHLGHWCQGFLAGIAEGQPPEEAEMLEDLAAIAHAGLDGEETGEAAEADFTVISEHVRMIALHLCEREPVAGRGLEPAPPGPAGLFRRGPPH